MAAPAEMPLRMHDRQKELSASVKLLELIRADKTTSAESIKSDAAGDREFGLDQFFNNDGIAHHDPAQIDLFLDGFDLPSHW
jgi:hypothetical protein